MKKIKVAHLTSVHLDVDDRIFHKECVSLNEYGFETHLVVINSKSRVEKGVIIHSIEFKKTGRLSRMSGAVNAVYKKALELDADIYHFHDPELLRIGLKLKKKGKIVIYDAHEDLPRDILDKPYLKFRKTISKIVERYENRIAKRLSGIIAATPFIRNRFLKINPNTIDINNYPLLHELILDNIERIPNNNVCYVGGITKIRGIKEIVQSLGHCNAQLYLAGQFTESGVKDEVSALPEWSKVKDFGYINREEVKNLYANVSVGLVIFHPVPNHIDSQPAKMYEYMITGLPIVCSNFEKWKAIVEKENFGICVDPMAPTAIGKAVQYLLDNPKLAIEMGERGRNLVLEKYNWNIEKEKLIKFYNNILEK